LTKLRSYAYKLSRFFTILGMLSLLLVAFITTFSVGMRHVTGSEVIASINIAEFGLVIITFLGLSWTQINKGHVAAEFVFDRFSNNWKKILEVFICIISLFYMAILLWASWSIAMYGYDHSETTVATGRIIIIWPIRFVLPVGIFLYGCILLFDLKDSLTKLLKNNILKNYAT